MCWKFQLSLPTRVLMFKCSRDPTQLHHKVGLVSVQLIEEIAVAHQVEDGATKSLLFVPYLALAAWRSVRPLQTVMLVTALHPGKCRSFQ